MMMVAPLSPGTVARLFCWLAAGDDDARPDRPPVHAQGQCSSLQDRSSDDGSPSKWVSVLDDGSAGGFTKPTLHQWRQRNPHSAR